MSQMVAYCGLLCNECPTYIATMNNDDELRRKTAKEWGRMFHADLKPEQMNCKGCLSEERFSHCSNCNIRS